MKIGSKEEIILDVLRQQEMEGREIVKQSHGAIGYAGIYSRLARMEEKGLIEKAAKDNGFHSVAQYLLWLVKKYGKRS